tara:strand:+ start:188 stop:682 length:495 start_codon:yes stop_codon:yes gene_type:complete
MNFHHIKTTPWAALRPQGVSLEKLMKIMTIGHGYQHIMTNPQILENTTGYLKNRVTQLKATEILVSLAPGTDRILTEIAKELNIPFSVYMPFSRSNSKIYIRDAATVTWTNTGKFFPYKIRKNFDSMLSTADHCIFVWNGKPGLISDYFTKVKNNMDHSLYNPF